MSNSDSAMSAPDSDMDDSSGSEYEREDRGSVCTDEGITSAPTSSNHGSPSLIKQKPEVPPTSPPVPVPSYKNKKPPNLPKGSNLVRNVFNY